MDEVPAEKWETLIQVNLLAPMRLSSLFAADMIRRRQGHIVNISSASGWVVPPGMAHYGASKFALRGFSEGLLNEVKIYNVKVTAVYPFFSRTPILQSEQYGSLAKPKKEVPDFIITDPAKVMGKTIQAIIDDKPQVSPYLMANIISVIKRFLPQLLTLIFNRFNRKQIANL